VRASIKKVRWGKRKLYFTSGAGAGAPASQELVQKKETQSVFQVQELVRQHDEGALGGTRSVFQIQELVRYHDEGKLEPRH